MDGKRGKIRAVYTYFCFRALREKELKITLLRRTKSEAVEVSSFITGGAQNHINYIEGRNGLRLKTRELICKAVIIIIVISILLNVNLMQ